MAYKGSTYTYTGRVYFSSKWAIFVYLGNRYILEICDEFLPRLSCKVTAMKSKNCKTNQHGSGPKQSVVLCLCVACWTVLCSGVQSSVQ